MKRKILIYAVLVSVFLFSLTGCSGQGGRTSSNDNDTQEAGNSENSQTPDMETAGTPEDKPHSSAQNTDINTNNPENTSSSETSETAKPNQEQSENTMKIIIGNTILTAILADNPSVDALKELLKKGPLTIHMSDYANMEKVGPIGTSLPRADTQINAGPGDIILYQGSSLVIYYDKNSWNFTRIGKIDGVTPMELKNILGSGDVTASFSLADLPETE